MIRYRIQHTIPLTIFFTLLTLSALGQVNQTGVPALRVEPDPVSTGRGFTGVAQADEASAVFWNPAGLGFQRGLQLGASRFKWLPGLDNELAYNYLMGRYAIEGVGTIGSHITYLDLGSHSLRDGQGNSSGDFSSYEFSIGASIGRELIPERLAVGLGLRFISSRLTPSGVQVGSYETRPGNTFGIDAGALYKLREYTVAGFRSVPSIGMSITNFGGRVSYTNSGYKDALPTLLRVGGSNTFFLDPERNNTLTVNAELSKLMVRSDSTGTGSPFGALVSSWGSYSYFDGQRSQTVSLAEQLMYGVGMEYWYYDMLALRTGYYHESPKNGGRKFLTVGASIKYDLLQINSSIAFQQGSSAVNSIFRIGFSVNLDRPKPTVKQTVPAVQDTPPPTLEPITPHRPDRDDDGIIDAQDHCPGEAGQAALNGCPDTDGDAIADSDDRCPGEPGTIHTQGCPDADADGVADHLDACGEATGSATFEGCPIPSFDHVIFDFDSAELQPQIKADLDRLASILTDYPQVTIQLHGYADPIGPGAYNQELSERRAKAVKKYLTDKGIHSDRIRATGHGEITLEETSDEPQKNRMVEVEIIE